MTSQEEKLLTAAELAAQFPVPVSEHTINNWRMAGKGPPFYRVGGRVFYRLSTAIQWINEQQDKPRPRRKARGAE